VDADVDALEANLWSMWAQFGRGDGCRLVDRPELLRFETPLGQVPYNAVLRFRAAEHDADGAIDHALEPYRTRGVAPVWFVHPTTRPADVRVRLEARGLVHAETIPGMVARVDDVPLPGADPPGVVVDEVHVNDVTAFIDLISWRYELSREAAPTLSSIIAAAGFGEPGSPNRAWVARRDGDAVAKASLHLVDGVAGIYGVATRPDARRLGLARHLTARALAAARAAGARLAVLHSSPMAVDLYRGLGFRPATAFELFAPPDMLHL
jgi:ribosomal protein S18 acetylase RimI-like enzyme